MSNRIILAGVVALFATVAYAQQSNIGGIASRLRLQALGVGVAPPASGNISASGTITGASLVGALDASSLASGTVPDARFPATLPAVSGSNLTALNASNLGSGTVASARLPFRFAFFSNSNLAGTCTAYGASSGISNCTRSTAGVYVLTFASAFGAAPSCTANTAGASAGWVTVLAGTTIVDIIARNSSGVATDSHFSITCIGT